MQRQGQGEHTPHLKAGNKHDTSKGTQLEEPSAPPGGMDREGKTDSRVPGLPACSRLYAEAGDVFPAHKNILQVLGATREYQAP